MLIPRFKWSTKAFNDYVERYGRTSERRLPLTRLLAGNPAHGIAPLPDATLVAEIVTMLFAGTDTTGNTLTYLFFELARHPDWLARLRSELASVPSARAAAAGADTAAAAGLTHHTNDDNRHEISINNNNNDDDDDDVANSVPPHDDLQNLPVLNAIIWETLRRHPAVPVPLPRIVPKGGAPVAGRFLPAGTAVGVLTCGLQRTAAVFPDGDAWDPQRWLAVDATPNSSSITSGSSAGTNSSGDGKTDTAAATASAAAAAAAAATAGVASTGVGGTEAMRAHMLVFGRGQRICLGRAIALMQLRMAVSAVAQRFASVRVASAQTLDDMQMRDHFVLVPKGGKCMLVFE